MWDTTLKRWNLQTRLTHRMSRSRDGSESTRLQAWAGTNELIALLDPPQGAGEAVRLVSLLLDAGRLEEATACLDAASALVGRSTHQELSAAIAARRVIS